MKFLPLVWHGIWRKPARAVLILLQVVVAFVLFGILQGLSTGVKQAIAKTHADRLYVLSKVSMGAPLPLALLPRIKALHGVLAVNYRTPLPMTYRNPDQTLAGIATDPASFARVFPEIHVPSAQLQALVHTPTGAIVGQALASKYGWKVGDRIPLQSSVTQKDGSGDWTFDVVGIYTLSDYPEQANNLLLNYGYVNEARQINRNSVQLYTVLIADPTQSAQIGHDIDALFANSPNETRTQSESDLAQSQVQQIGNIEMIAHAVTAAAFFALLFATGALMMQSIRERVPELAVLKTVGFSDRRVMTLILAEALLLCLIGAALGLWIASELLPLAQRYIGIPSVPGIVIVAGLVCALILAVVAGAIPAWRGLRLQVVDALSGR